MLPEPIFFREFSARHQLIKKRIVVYSVDWISSILLLRIFFTATYTLIEQVFLLVFTMSSGLFDYFWQLKNKVSLSYKFKSSSKKRATRFIITPSLHLLCLMVLFDPLAVYAQAPFRYTNRAFLGVMVENGDEVELIDNICSERSEEDDILRVSFSLLSVDEGWLMVDGEGFLSANQDYVLAPGECYPFKLKYSPHKTGKSFATVRFECHFGNTLCNQGITKSVEVVSKETFSRYRSNGELIPLGDIDLGGRFSHVVFTDSGQTLRLETGIQSQALKLGSLFTDTLATPEEVTMLRLASCSAANGDRVECLGISKSL